MTSPPLLLLITDRGVAPDLEKEVAAALKGGVRHILLREKNAPPRETITLARSLNRIVTEAGGALLVSERTDIALTVGAAGVHLPENGLPTAAARKLLGPNKLLGRSCHAVETAVKAFADGADYVTLSPLFATRSHPDAEPLGLERFAAMVREIPGPVLALGGVDADNAREAVRAGAAGAALIRGLLGAPEIEAAARTLLRRLRPMDENASPRLPFLNKYRRI